MRKIFSLSLLFTYLFLFFAASNASVQAGVPCAGSPNSQLVPGTQGRVAQLFSSLRSAPAGPVLQLVYSPATFTVLEGPVCAGYGPLAWYRIDYGNGLVGWASEGEVYSIYGNDQYWLLPGAAPVVTPAPTVTPGPVPGVCAGSLASQLTVGATGRVAQRFSTLRTTPAGPAIREVYSPATFTVVGGPICAGGILFWEIDYGSGLRGWAAESEVYSIYGYNQYWLLPG